MKVFIPLGLFFGVVCIGFMGTPVPLGTLVGVVVGLAVVEWLMYRFARWQATRQRIGVVEEPLGVGSEVKFLNNPWAKGLGNLPATIKLLIGLQIAWLTAGSLFCGEMMYFIIFRP